MKLSRIFMMGWLLISFVSINTAVFKIINKSGAVNPAFARIIKVQPIWNGSSANFVALKSGEETGWYDTGPNNLTGLIYEVLLPRAADFPVFCMRRYKANFDISGRAVGGKIYVQKGDEVAYSFDTIAGSATVKAQSYFE